MISTAARNIRITSPIRPKPFAVRLIALPKTSSFAQEIFEKYSGIVENDMTTAPFVFLNMFGKELAEEREQYYRMMLTLRLMIAHKLVVSGKLGDPTVSSAYTSAVRMMISETLNYFRSSGNIIYNKLIDARNFVETSDVEALTGARQMTQESLSEPVAAQTLIYSFSEGEERYYRELLENTVTETIFENIGSYPADTQSLIFRRYEHITEKTDAVSEVTEKQIPADVAEDPVIPEHRAAVEDTEFSVLTHRTPEHDTENGSVQEIFKAPAAEKSVTVITGKSASRRRDSALSAVMSAEGEKYIPLMNTMLSGGSRYFAYITGKYVNRRTLPASVIRPVMETVRTKKTRETFPLVVKALDILTAPDKANSQERAVYEYAVSTVWMRRMIPGQPETVEMFSRLDRKERTDALVLAVSRLIKVSGKEAGRTIRYPDGKNRKRELSASESALIWAITRDEHGAVINELSRSVKNNVIINRLEKLYLEHASVSDPEHAAVTDNIERVLSSKVYSRSGYEKADVYAHGDRTADTYAKFTLLSLLMSAGKEGTAAAVAVLPDVIRTEKTTYSELPVRSPSMILRKPSRENDRTFYEEFFERLVSRNITLSEAGIISAELSKERPAIGVITKRIENIIRSAETFVDEAVPGFNNYGTADITLFSRMNNKISGTPENTAGKIQVQLLGRPVVTRESVTTYNGTSQPTGKPYNTFENTAGMIPAQLRERSAVTRDNAGTYSDASRAAENFYSTSENADGKMPVQLRGRSVVTREDIRTSGVTSRIAESSLSDAADESSYVSVFSGGPGVFLEKSDIPASVKKIYEEIIERSVGMTGTRGKDEALSEKSVRTVAETLMLRGEDSAKRAGETLIKFITEKKAQNIPEVTAAGRASAAVFRTEADTRSAVRTLAKLIGSLAVTEKTDTTVFEELPAPGMVYNIITQRPAGYVGGTLRNLPAWNIRTLAKTLSVPSAVRTDILPESTETVYTADTARLSYRSTAPAPQQAPVSGGNAPTKDELIEQFGNLIEGIDPTKPMSSVKMIDGNVTGGSELEQTIEKLRETSEKTEHNTKLIEEISKKQQEIEKALKKSSDIGTISEEVMKQLRMQLRFDSSRFMS